MNRALSNCRAIEPREAIMLTSQGLKIVSVLISLLIVSGCAGKEHYKEVFNEGSKYNSRIFEEPIESVWVVAEKVVLAQGFILEKTDKNAMAMVATRLFKEDDETATLVLSVTARAEGKGTILFATANQTKEKFHSARSYNWFLIIPRPTGSTAASVKMGGETIEDPEFFQKFFHAVEKEIAQAKRGKQG